MPVYYRHFSSVPPVSSSTDPPRFVEHHATITVFCIPKTVVRNGKKMKVILQRVNEADVTVADTIVGSIGRGVLLLVGVQTGDTEPQADFLADKCANLRIFPDDDGRMNRSLVDIDGEALVVSQFTLLGDCSKGRRPSFINAAPPDRGDFLYRYFVDRLRLRVKKVETGIFGAMMQVRLVNDGPVTMLLEK